MKFQTLRTTLVLSLALMSSQRTHGIATMATTFKWGLVTVCKAAKQNGILFSSLRSAWAGADENKITSSTGLREARLVRTMFDNIATSALIDFAWACATGTTITYSFPVYIGTALFTNASSFLAIYKLETIMNKPNVNPLDHQSCWNTATLIASSLILYGLKTMPKA